MPYRLFRRCFVSYRLKIKDALLLNELELIQRLRTGDEAAFKFLVENYQDRVFNTAIGIVQNAEDAEDVAQEVFIQVFRSIHSFKAESKLSTWIYRITTTRALDHLRNRKSKKRFGLLQRLFAGMGRRLVVGRGNLLGRGRAGDSVHRLLVRGPWRSRDGLGRRCDCGERKGGNQETCGKGFHGHLLSCMNNRQ